MKYLKSSLLLFLLLFGLGIGSIKAQTHDRLLGTWEIHSKSGGIGGKSNHYPKGNGNYLIYEKSGDYKNLFGGKISSKGKFTIVSKKSRLTHRIENFIQYHPGKDLIEYYQLKADTLFLHSDIPDGFSYSYIRIK